MDAMDHLRELFGSQRAIADALGVGDSTVSMWNENGIPAARRLELVRLCQERGIPLDMDLLLGLRTHDPKPVPVAA